MSFTQVPFTDSQAGIIWHTDPVIDVDDSGHVHMLIQYSATFINHYFSLDGQTWLDTVQINSYNGVDKPWMVVNKNEIYVTWQQTSGQQGIWFCKSTDYGRTFQDSLIWTRRGITAICMDEAENLHLCLVDWYGSVYYRKSTDKGVTWSDPLLLSDYYYQSGYGDRAPINSITATGNAVFLTWVDTRNGDWDIMGMRSTDGGSTWGSRFVVNDSTVGGQCKGWTTFDPYGGLHLIYYHCPYWPTSPTTPFSLRYQYSPDSGATFKPSIRVSDTCAPSLADFMGEYHIIRSDSQYVYAIWTSGRNGDDNDLYFSKALISEVGCAEQIAGKPATGPTVSIPTIWRGNVVLEISHHSEPIKINLYDASGRIVKKVYSGRIAGSMKIKIRSKDLPSGVLFIRISSDNTSQTRKVVNLR